MDVSSSDGMVVLKHSCSTLKFLALRCRVLCPLLFHQGGLGTVSTGGILQRAQERPCSLLHWDAWPHSDPGSNMWVKHDFTTLKGGHWWMLRWPVPAVLCLLAILVKNQQCKTHHRPSGTLKSLLMPLQTEELPGPAWNSEPPKPQDKEVVVVSHWIWGISMANNYLQYCNKKAMITHVKNYFDYDLNTWKVKAGRSGVQGQLQLHNQFKTCPSSMRQPTK